MNKLQQIFNILVDRPPNVGDPAPPKTIKTRGVLPVTRSTEPPNEGNGMYGFPGLESNKSLVNPGYQYEIIPFIRKLSINNPNVAQALNNYVSLANTGYKVVFDSGVKDDQVDKMRNHLKKVSKNWQYGSAGIHGIINTLLSQGLIAGGVAAEVIPNKQLTGVARIGTILPESIRFVYNKTTETYEPYQKVKNPSNTNVLGLKPLNINTFRYVKINGDSELPYGNPAYLPALKPLEDQSIMLDNIKFIIRQMGVLGFLEMKMEQPVQRDGEIDSAYEARLKSFLLEAVETAKSSMRNGIVVGYKDDHEFEFHSSAKNAAGVRELFDNNELLVQSGLQSDPALSGRSSGSGENVTILFTKLLSQLKNIQLAVAYILEHAFEMEFRLAGFNFEWLEVQFSPSTIQDDLKMQQAEEIKIRNARQLRVDGIISQDQYADRVGIEKAFKQTPEVPWEGTKAAGTTGDPSTDSIKKQAREKEKDASDRKSRDKKKPQGNNTR